MSFSAEERMDILFNSAWERTPQEKTTIVVKQAGYTVNLPIDVAQKIIKLWESYSGAISCEKTILMNFYNSLRVQIETSHVYAIKQYIKYQKAPEYHAYKTFVHRCAIAVDNHNKRQNRPKSKQHKLDYYGEKIMTHRTKEEIKMQNAAALIMEGLTTVDCIYQADNDLHRTYKFLVDSTQATVLQSRIAEARKNNVNEMDFLAAVPLALAPKNDGGYTILRVVAVDEEPEIELEGEIYYKFLSEILPSKTTGEVSQALRDKIAEKIKGKRRVSTRNQLLAQYGIDADEIKTLTNGDK